MAFAGKFSLLLEAVLHIAFQGDATLINGKRLSTLLNVPPRYLESLLQELVKANILQSVRGPKGGYVLAREKRVITLADIASVCYHEAQKTKDASSPLQIHIIQPLCEDAYAAYITHFAGYTLHDLGEMVKQEKLDAFFVRDESATLHYAI
jgi:Rrf2 family transcriptional regulator, iron-sulfur cluster assembly transcription factor